jgi:HAD superfamily hydrolase (TIGR01484 family)
MLDPSTLNRLKNIRLIATDMDGTLTTEGRFAAATIETLEILKEAGIIVLIVTGRSAGWVNAIFNYLPIEGAIAENGGLFYADRAQAPEMLVNIDRLLDYRDRLQTIFEELQSKFPRIQESVDNCFRLTDWTFDIADLTITELDKIDAICRQWGWGFTYSTVQCHIKQVRQNKADSLLKVLNQYFPQIRADEIITVGDSPNDESLFDRHKFSLSAGVANLLHYREQLQHQPIFITDRSEGNGFRELAELILKNN